MFVQVTKMIKYRLVSKLVPFCLHKMDQLTCVVGQVAPSVDLVVVSVAVTLTTMMPSVEDGVDLLVPLIALGGQSRFVVYGLFPLTEKYLMFNERLWIDCTVFRFWTFKFLPPACWFIWVACGCLISGVLLAVLLCKKFNIVGWLCKKKFFQTIPCLCSWTRNSLFYSVALPLVKDHRVWCRYCFYTEMSYAGSGSVATDYFPQTVSW